MATEDRRSSLGRLVREEIELALDLLAAKVPADEYFLEDEADNWGWSDEEREDDANRTQIMVGWTREEAKLVRELLARHDLRDDEMGS